MPETQISETVPEKGQRQYKTDPEKQNKYNAYAMLVNQGMSKSQAAKTIGYSIGSIGALERHTENKTQKTEFLTPSRIKRAQRVVDSLMAGKGFGSIESVKDSTALKAAEAVLDRAHPKAQEGVLPNISFTQINLNVVANPEPKPIEAYVCEPVTT